ncbi:hypothetical protein SAMN04488526_2284 [Jannaschia helgolandensis]|uniref:Uncharacterized protein n=1 Tax=Jannaschia helgolandensis TaxID=188906 RepID=A0A1H7NRC4_9RHOB|nr:hypothetical protein SAMN04488526_2284 [Jannaschia helgolandensis]
MRAGVNVSPRPDGLVRGRNPGLANGDRPAIDRAMSNATAAVVAILLVSVIGADWLFNDAQGLNFMGRRLMDLIEYIAFWR